MSLAITRIDGKDHGLKTLVTVQSMKGMQTREFDTSYVVFIQAMAAYNDGAHVQNAFSFLSTADREFLMTGTTQEEWDELFSEEDS